MNGFDLSTVSRIRLGGATVRAVYYGSTKIWPHDYSQDYLTFEALEAGTFTWNDSHNNNSISYSIDGGSTWTILTSGSSTPTINANSKVIFKASGLTVSTYVGIGIFGSSGRFKVMGNIMSLIYGDNFANQTTINNDWQFSLLFFGCSNLVDASNLILPATTLSQGCYASMFNFCSSLTTAPELPATTLSQGCYSNMFVSCSSLTTAPELPATTLALQCYSAMFYGCTALTTAPELPATTLALYCYEQMFQDCSSLTTAPELPATTLTERCYYQMFYGCSSLNYIKCLATDISATNCTSNWVNGVSNNGTFVRAANNTSWTIGNDGIPTGWIVDPPLAHDYSQDYLTFEALEAGTFTWKDPRSNNSISYSIDDGSTWTTLTAGSSTPTINANSKVIFKASGLTFSSYGIGTFSSSGRFNVMGNIMSLVDGDNFVSSTTLSNTAQFSRLFYHCANLVDASNLILPATTLTERCYYQMFQDCSSLTTAPELPATTLAIRCYSNMFSGCRSLTTAPALPATTLASACYDSMFYLCTALTAVPVLPATTLATRCYNYMFNECSSLNYIKCLATDISATNCTYNWVRSVSNNGTFVKAASMTDWTTGDSGIPSGWTVQDAT